MRVEPGGDRGRGDAGAAQIVGEGLDQADDGVFGGAVARQMPQSVVGRGRGHTDEPSGSGCRLPQHGRDGGPHEIGHTVDADIEHRRPLVVCGLPQRLPAGHHGGRGHRRVETAEGVDRDDPPALGGELMHRGRADTTGRARDDGHRCGVATSLG